VPRNVQPAWFLPRPLAKTSRDANAANAESAAADAGIAIGATAVVTVVNAAATATEAAWPHLQNPRPQSCP